MEEKTPKRQLPQRTPIPLSELTRQQVGLVNDIRPPKPQPPKETKRTTAGGKKAAKILRGQR